MAFVDEGFGSIHFRREAQQIVSHPLSILTAPIRSTVSAVRRAGTTVLNPLVALRKTGAELKRARPLVTAITKTLLNPIATAKIALNPMSQMKNIGGVFQKQSSASSQDVTAQNVYQDANGNIITKEQYDYLMAQHDQAPTDVYQDANGNVITKEQYDAIMAQQNLVNIPGGESGQYLDRGSITGGVGTPVQMQQSSVDSSGGRVSYPGSGGSEIDQEDSNESSMQTSPIDVTSGVLDRQVQAALLAIKSKVASGNPLTANEKDFVDFMAKATVQVGPISGFGFLPLWDKQAFPILQVGDTDKRLFSENVEELPSVSSQPMGAYDQKENFEGIEDWCKI